MKNLLTYLLAISLLGSFQSNAQVPVYNSFPSAAATIFLDFDGHTVEGTSWNAFGPIFCEPANISNTQITEIFNRVAEDYRPFNINITTDSNRYWSAPVFQRQRIIVTVTSSWYGSAGGVSYLNSFKWGDHTPAFVFSALLGYNTKRIAEASSHEAGHTLGLKHQSTYNTSCIKTAEYNPGAGSGEIGWAPIMGVSYNRNLTLWNHGTNPQGCNVLQDDLAIITSLDNGFGFRPDDHASTPESSVLVPLVNEQFVIDGVIETTTDLDVFKIYIPSLGNLRLDAVPYNIGSGNSGSNLDIQLEILNENQQVLTTYNPGNILNLQIDSTFTAGTYYLRIQGKGNIYAPEYASLGSYSIISSFRPMAPLPLHKLELKGNNGQGQHHLNWVIEADEQVTGQVLEVSAGNNRNFQPLGHLNANARSYTSEPASPGWLHYRLHVSFDDGKSYYSNIVALPANEGGSKPELQGNLIGSSLIVKSAAGFSYQVFDYNGRLVMQGRLSEGINHLPFTNFSSGMYLIRFRDEQFIYNEKFMKK